MILEAAFAYAIDGDTLALGNARVRLWGIQADERGTGWRAEKARFVLQRTVASGVVCHVWTRDRYGRHVGMCFAQGRDVAWELVSAGLAEDWPRYSQGYYRQKGS